MELVMEQEWETLELVMESMRVETLLVPREDMEPDLMALGKDGTAAATESMAGMADPKEVWDEVPEALVLLLALGSSREQGS